MTVSLAKFIYIISTALLVACVHSGMSNISIPSGQLHRVTRDYAAIGDASNIQPFVYNEHTMIRKNKNKPQFDKITDDQGNPLNYTEQDGYYVLDDVIDSFVVSGTGRTVKFERVNIKDSVESETSLYTLSPIIDKNESLSIENNQDLNNVTSSTNTTVASFDTKTTTHQEVTDTNTPIFVLMKQQVAKQRELLEHQTAKESKLKKELAEIQEKLTSSEAKMESGTALIHVHFPFGSTVFKPEYDLADTLTSSALQAKRITLFGRTDSRVADAINKKIARGRALHVRHYLIQQGVSAEKIKTFSRASGDFIMPSNTPAGQSLNRRVTIELVMRE